MTSDKNRYRLFSRRAALLAGGQFALFGALGARLYYLQVHEADRYRMLADENRISPRLLPPSRGYIVDRHGEPLAINVQNYRAVIVPEQAGDVHAMLVRLGRLIAVDDHDLRRILREVRRRRPFVPITVRENLSWQEVSRVEVNAPDLPGISIEVGQSRYYPHGGQAAHVLGYVAAVSEKDLTGDPVLELPGFRIGKSGIERQYDLLLRGKAGSSEVEVNALGRVIRELRRDEGQPGETVALTLDIGLQLFVANRLRNERRAAVVVMDAHDGDVLAMVSVPSFDPNAFNEGLTSAEWRALIHDPDHPLTNKAIAGQYAPGSTYKVSVALTALENGIAPDLRVFCPGHIDLGDTRFHCWREHGHGWLDMAGAIRESCDVYFYELAQRVGVDRMAEMARRLGFGSQLGIDLPGEAPGLIPTRQWKRAAIGVPWQRGETLIAGIGQGFVLATPLQLATMTARVVNGGYAVTPHLTREASRDNAAVQGDAAGAGEEVRPTSAFPSLGISDRALEIVMQGMYQVVNHPRGTARRSRITEPEHAMGGKSGTSQVRRTTMADRAKGIENEDRPWNERTHALFIAYAPTHAPRYVVSVIVEHGGGGSAVAAPIAHDVLEEVQRLDPSGGTPLARVARDEAPPAGASGKTARVVER